MIEKEEVPEITLHEEDVLQTYAIIKKEFKKIRKNIDFPSVSNLSDQLSMILQFKNNQEQTLRRLRAKSNEKRIQKQLASNLKPAKDEQSYNEINQQHYEVKFKRQKQSKKEVLRQKQKLQKKYEQAIEMMGKLRKEIQQLKGLREQFNSKNQEIEKLKNQVEEHMNNVIKENEEKQQIKRKYSQLREQNENLQEKFEQINQKLQRKKWEQHGKQKQCLSMLQTKFKEEQKEFQNEIEMVKDKAKENQIKKEKLINEMVKIFSKKLRFLKKENESNEQWFEEYLRIEKNFQPKENSKNHLDFVEKQKKMNQIIRLGIST